MPEEEMGIYNNLKCGTDKIREPCQVSYKWEDGLHLERNEMSYSHKLKRIQ